jgi:hypothetical protein
MLPPGGNLVRLVVQWVCAGDDTAGYRVICYPEDARFPNPLALFSREELLRRLSKVFPDFDEKQLRPEERPPQIVFAAAVELTDAQIATLLQ